MIYHRKHARTSVEVWERELKKATISQKLTFLYLCNDVLQSSRRKGEDFTKEFARILPSAFGHIYRHAPGDIQMKVMRLLAIWEERQVYTTSFLQDIRSACTGTGGTTSGGGNAVENSPTTSSSPLNGNNTPVRRSSSSDDNKSEAVKALLHRMDNVKHYHTMRQGHDPAVKKLPAISDDTLTKLSDETARGAALTLSAFSTALATEIDERRKLVRDLRTMMQSEERQIAMSTSLLTETQRKIDILSNHPAGTISSTPTTTAAPLASPSTIQPPPISSTSRPPTIPLALPRHSNQSQSQQLPLPPTSPATTAAINAIMESSNVKEFSSGGVGVGVGVPGSGRNFNYKPGGMAAGDDFGSRAREFERGGSEGREGGRGGLYDQEEEEEDMDMSV
ncbi:Regulation of nuclear pre-mRNA domain-containing protein 1A [Blyttiomyces sp. JEL0837]|nr:Regulation of nuclear pre-mRNA domain-containing protein 1A [Blyttiomyces sp. JEL0837]